MRQWRGSGETCNTHGVYKKCVHNLGQKSWQEDASPKHHTIAKRKIGFILLRTEIRWWALVNMVMNAFVPYKQ
jgi:hypothetical protein